VLGKKGLAAVERLMGLLLTTVSVEMCVRGLHDIFGSTG
jgi:small neutral amino acid transporter SnatA (MarC family)